MNLDTILKVLNSALALIGFTGSIAKSISDNVSTVIKNAEAEAGKALGDMTDDELAELLETPTKTTDELIGDVD